MGPSQPVNCGQMNRFRFIWYAVTLERRVSLVLRHLGFSLAVAPSGCRGDASALAVATSVRLISRSYVRLLI